MFLLLTWISFEIFIFKWKQAAKRTTFLLFFNLFLFFSLVPLFLFFPFKKHPREWERERENVEKDFNLIWNFHHALHGGIIHFNCTFPIRLFTRCYCRHNVYAHYSAFSFLLTSFSSLSLSLFCYSLFLIFPFIASLTQNFISITFFVHKNVIFQIIIVISSRLLTSSLLSYACLACFLACLPSFLSTTN